MSDSSAAARSGSFVIILMSSAALCLQVNVPHAEMEEILPAARLLNRATAVAPADYDRAKAQFLAGLKDVGLHSQVSLLLMLPANGNDTTAVTMTTSCNIVRFTLNIMNH